MRRDSNVAPRKCSISTNPVFYTCSTIAMVLLLPCEKSDAVLHGLIIDTMILLKFFKAFFDDHNYNNAKSKGILISM